MNLIKKIFLFLFLSGVLNFYSQDFSFRNYSVKDGLPSSEVYKVIQDEKGYVWFATDAGVSKFDGYLFKNFTTDEGLPDNTVLNLFDDLRGKIWFYTFAGHFGYIENDSVTVLPASKTFQKLKLSLEIISSFYVDKNLTVWAGTSGGKGFFKITYPYNEKDLSRIKLENSGVYVSFIENEKFIAGNFSDSANNYDVSLVSVYNKEKPEKQLFKKKCKGYAPRCYQIKGNEFFIFDETGYARMNRDLILEENSTEETFFSVYFDSENQLWLGSHKKGLYLFSDGKFGNNSKNILNGISVTYILQDREGGYWLTTLENGIYYLPSNSFIKYDEQSGLPVNKIIRVKCFGKDSLAAETNNGDICILENGKLTNYLVKNNSLETGPDKIIKYPDDFILLSSMRSSWFYYYKDHCLKHIMGTTASPALKSFTKTGDGKLIGMLNYIVEIDPKTRKGTATIELPERMFCAYTSSDGITWLGGLHGLWRMEKNIISYEGDKNPLFKNRIEGICEGKKGLLIFATRGAGVILKSGNDISNLKTKDGLSSNICRTVVSDSAGRFWIGTNKGISKLIFHGRNYFETENYSTNEGLISNEVNKLSIAGNILWIATNSGLARLDLTKAFVNKSMPLIYISDYSVNSQKQNSLQPKVFDHNENYFVINFTGISFHDFGKVKYKYMLEGLDTAWHYSYNNSIQYTPLQPGNYTFKIYAVNRNGIQSKSPATFQFSISKPYWKKWWFSILLASIVFGGFYFFYKDKTKKIRQKEIEKAEMNAKIAGMELKALRAQMNPHFIFNAINSIQNFILKNDSDNAHRYLSRFSKLIRNVLENSEHEEITLQQEIETLDLYLQIEALRFGFKFNYRILVDEKLDKLSNIPSMIIQPYLENAIWHGLMHKEGERNLTLEIKKEGGNFIHCIVDDDGIGRKKAGELKTTGKTLHTSLGMAITRDRLEILNKQYGILANVIITDKKGTDGNSAGTRIEIFIPLKS